MPEEVERRRLEARAQELDEAADQCRICMHEMELRKLQKKANTRALAQNRQRARRQCLKLAKVCLAIYAFSSSADSV